MTKTKTVLIVLDLSVGDDVSPTDVGDYLMEFLMENLPDDDDCPIFSVDGWDSPPNSLR